MRPEDDEPNIDFRGHVLDYAAQQIAEMIDDPPPDLIVQLTLDLELQTGAEAAVSERISTLGPDRGASEAAAILMDRSGAIRAMIGGVDYETSQFNRAVQARRQPGSAFKMFVFAAALEAGMSPRTIRYDEPIRIGDWRPRNYGREYRGAVTLAEALAESLNTVSATIGVETGLRERHRSRPPFWHPDPATQLSLGHLGLGRGHAHRHDRRLWRPRPRRSADGALHHSGNPQLPRAKCSTPARKSNSPASMMKTSPAP